MALLNKCVQIVGGRSARFVGAGTVLILLVWLLFLMAKPSFSRWRFHSNWLRLMTEMQSPEDLIKSITVDERPVVWTKWFSDGSWVAVRGESIAGGDLFNQTLIRESGGRVFCTDYAFSGFEGLSEYLGRVTGDTSAAFADNFAKQFLATEVTVEKN